MSKKYRVDVWSEETYKKIFIAKSKEEAEEMALKEIEDEGIEVGVNNWDSGSHVDCGITYAEEIK